MATHTSEDNVWFQEEEKHRVGRERGEKGTRAGRVEDARRAGRIQNGRSRDGTQGMGRDGMQGMGRDEVQGMGRDEVQGMGRDGMSHRGMQGMSRDVMRGVLQDEKTMRRMQCQGAVEHRAEDGIKLKGMMMEDNQSSNLVRRSTINPQATRFAKASELGVLRGSATTPNRRESRDWDAFSYVSQQGSSVSSLSSPALQLVERLRAQQRGGSRR